MSINHASPTQPRGNNTGRLKAINPSTGKLETKETRSDFKVWARAPYNFVSLPAHVVSINEQDIPTHDKYFTDTYTGQVHCLLTTLTPVYVRSMMTVKDFVEYGNKPFNDLPHNQKADRAKFFNIENRPVIPGSSLRGMIRSLVEIAGFSKMEWVTNEPLVYRAVAESPDGDNATALGESYKSRIEQDGKSAVLPGYIWHRNGEWFIKPALPLDHHTLGVTKLKDLPAYGQEWRNCKNAQGVTVDLGKGAADSKGDWRYPEDSIKFSSDPNAVMVMTGAAVGRNIRKNNYLFGLPNNDDSNDIFIDDHLIQRYKDQISPAQINILYRKDASGGNNGVLRHGQPIFYLLTEKEEKPKLVFFGHARYFRLPYNNSPLDYVPKILRNNASLDLTDAIFGFVGRGADGTKSRSGRVFFTDAVIPKLTAVTWLPVREEKWLTPHILSSPQPTTFQNYLVQDPQSGHEPNCRADLAHYDTPLSETQIRGHKLYWRKNIGKGENAFEKLKFKGDITKGATQRTGLKPIDAGNTFCFDIHFENLKAYELGALLWALQLPDGHCHLIGMGKPLGMGAVQIQPELRLSARYPTMNKEVTSRYEKLFSDDGSWHIAESESNEKISKLIEEFRRFVMKELSSNATNGSANFETLERIAELLELMRWPPSPEAENWTRYMEITRTQEYGGFEVNEYAQRPVLPSPAHIVTSGVANHRVVSQCKQRESLIPKRNIGKEEPTPPRNIAPEGIPAKKMEIKIPEVRENVSSEAEKAANRLSAKRIAEGDIVTVTILRVIASEYECKVEGAERTSAKLPRDENRKLNVGDVLRAKVKRIAGSGSFILTLKGLPKE